MSAPVFTCVHCRQVLGDSRLRVSSNLDIFTKVYIANDWDLEELQGAFSCKTCRNAVETAARSLLRVEALAKDDSEGTDLSDNTTTTTPDRALSPLTPPTPHLSDEITLRAFLKKVSRKAEELSKSKMFAQCGSKPIEEFKLSTLSDFFQTSGGLVAQIVRAITGKEDPLGEVVAVAILLNQRSQKASSLQKLLGVALRASGCDKNVSLPLAGSPVSLPRSLISRAKCPPPPLPLDVDRLQPIGRHCEPQNSAHHPAGDGHTVAGFHLTLLASGRSPHPGGRQH